jgi:transcriptional regulator with PAS, ATPase and Fis domain
MKKILFAWIGKRDLDAAKAKDEKALGPVAHALRDMEIDEAVLLLSYREDPEYYKNWLTHQICVKSAIRINPIDDIRDPTDFRSIYECTVKTIQEALGENHNNFKIIFNISSGTPAMRVIWILLAKTRFRGEHVELIQSSEKFGVETVDVPFEIAAEYQPAMLKKTDEEIIRLSQGLPPESPNFENIICCSPVMKNVILMAHRLACRNLPVLIEGESGTGKELIARAIHKASPRSRNNFVAINCGAIPEGTADSELFGHEKGAFTGAAKKYSGKILHSSGGTLFLDEIGELPLDIQVRLLRVLQEKVVTPVGGNREEPADLRVIAATNRTLQKEVSEGRFREDLFYRLAAGYIYLPPLREREGDIGLLINHFLEKINQEEAEQDETYEYKKLSVSARNFMLNQSWPGNIRELEFTLQRAALLYSSGSVISLSDVRQACLPLYTKGNPDILEKTKHLGIASAWR